VLNARKSGFVVGRSPGGAPPGGGGGGAPPARPIRDGGRDGSIEPRLHPDGELNASGRPLEGHRCPVGDVVHTTQDEGLVVESLQGFLGTEDWGDLLLVDGGNVKAFLLESGSSSQTVRRDHCVSARRCRRTVWDDEPDCGRPSGGLVCGSGYRLIRSGETFR